MNNDKKKILILGSGMVSKPGIRYLIDTNKYFITIGTNEPEKAKQIVRDYSDSAVFFCNADDTEELAILIKESDIVVSLLPFTYHAKVAELCLDFRKHLVTTSYVSPAMRSFDSRARQLELIFLNEIGVDPGIDHMSAKKIIDKVQEGGGKILHFYSYCGGLPAPECNNNPLGYKFSWSPRGVLLAALNSAKYFENGILKEISNDSIFRNFEVEEIENLGTFEIYPNRDSTIYKEIYGLPDILTLKRGTYRYKGWCEFINAVIQLGLLDDRKISGLMGNSYKNIVKNYICGGSEHDLKHCVSIKLGVSVDSDLIKIFDWLGLFSNEIIPRATSLLDMLSDLMQAKLKYDENEYDMLLMKHKFIVRNSDKSIKQITSTLISYGIPGSDSAMSRTVSLPMACAVELIADGKINHYGVLIPVFKEIYIPVLEKLESLGIKLIEEEKTL